MLVGAEPLEIIGPTGCETYLGRKICFADFQQTELDSRIRAAWAAFFKYKAVFTSKAHSFATKAKLFEAAVTPVLLHGCSSWTLTEQMQHSLTTTWRRMLRAMLGARRTPDEEWVSFLKRSTHLAENRFVEFGYLPWTIACRQRKWRFAAKTAQASDARWSKRLLDWKPFFRCTPRRSIGRPHARWHDCFVRIVGGDWLNIANSDWWRVFEHGFVQGVA